ncbi:unnamed protein product [Prorocentrum cordatum]|uniref:Uncharacterized protein n=1 Tax=Prorocentrum cordatum TaxID=2364126 RepID=A0ABN9W1A6_9DINO|nr:unnamed protein product [Polarella glacialis]
MSSNMRKNNSPKQDKTTEQLKMMIPMMQQMMGQSKGGGFGDQDEIMKLMQGEDPEKEEMTNMMQTMLQNMLKMKNKKTQRNNAMYNMMQMMIQAMSGSSGSAEESPMTQMMRAMTHTKAQTKPKKLILEAAPVDGDHPKTDVPQEIKDAAKKFVPSIVLDSMSEDREKWIKEFFAMEGATQAKLNELLTLNSLSATMGLDKATKVRQLIAAVEP